MSFGVKGETPTKEELIDLYIHKRYSRSKIIKIYKIGFKTLDKLFMEYGIESRGIGTNQFNEWTFQKVKDVFLERNYILLETEYKNSNTKMKYHCHCGNVSNIVLSALLTGRGCNKCADLVRKSKRKLSYEEVESTFLKRNCILLSETYINSHSKLEYICHCGSKATMSYSNFKVGYDCADCKRKRFLGDKNHNYNPQLSDEDRLGLGRYEEKYKAWRKKVYKNAGYSCQICSVKGNGQLVAHHLEGYAENPDLRTDPNNGVALCIKCHKNFHRIYGYGGNTRKQFENFNRRLDNGC